MKQLMTILLLGAAALPVYAQETAPAAVTPQANQADIERLNSELKAVQGQMQAMEAQMKAMEAQRNAAMKAAEASAKAGQTPSPAPEAPTAPAAPAAPTAPTPPGPPSPPAVPTPPSVPGVSSEQVHIGSVMLTHHDYIVEPRDIVDGDVRIVQGDLQVNGVVNGDASTVSGNLEVNGHVMGNAVAVRGDISLGPNAVVEGDVQTTRGDINMEPGAQVHGMIRNDGHGTGAIPGDSRVESAMFASPFNLPVFIMMLMAGMVLLVAMPRRVDTVGRAFVNRPGHSFLVGLASFPLAVLAIAISAITVIGPIMVVFGYIGAFLMGVCAMALMLGRRLVLGKPYKSRFFPLVVGLAVWLGASVVSHVAPPLFVLMAITTGIAYVMAIGAALSTGFGKSPFWLRDRFSGRKVGGSYLDPTQTYAGADAYGDVS